MSIENLNQFQSSLSHDAALRKKVDALAKDTERYYAEKLAALSAEAGLPFTADEFLGSRELSEAQLEDVAGGIEDRYRLPSVWQEPPK